MQRIQGQIKGSRAEELYRTKHKRRCNHPNGQTLQASSSSSSGEQSNGSTVVNVTTHQDSRTFQVIAVNKMSHKAFQEMEPLLQEGRELGHYVDREAEQLIYIHLETMRFMDPTF